MRRQLRRQRLPTGAPVLPTFPTPVAVVAPGVEVRFRALVKQIKASADYNTSIGQALGIEGTPQIGPDFSSFGPCNRPLHQRRRGLCERACPK